MNVVQQFIQDNLLTKEIVNSNEINIDKGKEYIERSINNKKRWYVIHSYSGMEKNVQRKLIERINKLGMQKKFGRILVPTEEIVDVKKNQKSVIKKRFFPGYVLIEMEMTDESWHLVKNTKKVTGFIGGKSNRPTPISSKEIEEILKQIKKGVEKPRPKILYQLDELVRIKDGPFTDFSGNIEEVNYEKSRVRVSVTIFGRATPVELEFNQVEKI
ncbi:transcription termination/antitermination protein NusG [Candidatus Profftella armatura]|uniref:Transcription termination/antitermination protein NusG n=1 Tax=Candidatus Profftella armatura TaxID=669502 RepID=S5R7Z3_9PROT|nr:transcription termination/antitermination protein NusG [Candidatus Profftella armatura]AGS06715.1 transcription antitermination protein NusG [Candidatus Profftella armatura]